jgi:carboxylesterase type B
MSNGLVLYSVTFFDNSIARIQNKQIARVPILIGSMQDDGSLFTIGETNVTDFLNKYFPTAQLTPDLVRALYPGLNDAELLSAIFRDHLFLWWEPLFVWPCFCVLMPL